MPLKPIYHKAKLFQNFNSFLLPGGDFHFNGMSFPGFHHDPVADAKHGSEQSGKVLGFESLSSLFLLPASRVDRMIFQSPGKRTSPSTRRSLRTSPSGLEVK